MWWLKAAPPHVMFGFKVAGLTVRANHKDNAKCENELDKKKFHVATTGEERKQYGTNIRIFEYIRIILDKYIHPSKY